MSELREGSLIHISKFTNHISGMLPCGEGEVAAVLLRENIKCNRGYVFACLVLGVEPEDGSKPIDPAEFLIKRGWTPPTAMPSAPENATDGRGK